MRQSTDAESVVVKSATRSGWRTRAALRVGGDRTRNHLTLPTSTCQTLAVIERLRGDLRPSRRARVDGGRHAASAAVVLVGVLTVSMSIMSLGVPAAEACTIECVALGLAAFAVFNQLVAVGGSWWTHWLCPAWWTVRILSGLLPSAEGYGAAFDRRGPAVLSTF
jgi:hypothetical protein